eukprot:COSAG02_NODE_3519_length_6620_cov_7.023923_6_plen_61_part_00
MPNNNNNTPPTMPAMPKKVLPPLISPRPKVPMPHAADHHHNASQEEAAEFFPLCVGLYVL